MKYRGSCLCGNIQFEVMGEFENFFFCHCRSCRKDTGSAHAANLFSSTAELHWIKGEKDVRTFDYNNSGHIKGFCPRCGSALPNWQMDGTLLVVPAGSLDTDVDVAPTGHIFTGERANWDDHLEEAPSYENFLE